MTHLRGRLHEKTTAGCLAAIAATILWSCASLAADLTARDVSVLLFKAAPGSRPALNGKNLKGLDLAELDLRRAPISPSRISSEPIFREPTFQAQIFPGAMLDRVALIGARLDGANLDNASLMRPSTTTALTPNPSEAISFKSASLKGTKFFGVFAGSNFSGAILPTLFARR